MKSPQHVMAESQPLTAARASSVQLGRHDYVSVLLRLISMELYKIRRRVMSKVLSILSILAAVSLFALFALIALLMAKSGATTEAIRTFSETLRLPGSLDWTGHLLLSFGQVLVIILVSTIAGGEYTSGTIRLMLTRGPTRTQVLLSKAGAALVCIALGVLGVMIIGVLSGLLFNLTTGISQNFEFFDGAWPGHVLLYLLILILGLFVYAMMALCLATLGRATAAGLAGVLTWSFLLEPLIETIALFGRSIDGSTGSFVQSLPDYLIGPNISALLNNQSQYFLPSNGGLQIGGPSDWHALLVLAAYIILFIGMAWWVSVRRDVTN